MNKFSFCVLIFFLFFILFIAQFGIFVESKDELLLVQAVRD